MERNNSTDQTSSSEATTRLLYKNWREGFAFPMLIGLLIFGGIALIPALGSSQSKLLSGVFITTYILTGLVTIIRFSYLVRMRIVLINIFVLGISELLYLGILGDSLFFFLGTVIFATILLSPRMGLLAVIINIVTFILLGWLMLNGQISPINPNATPANIYDWISAGAVLIMFGSVIILGFQRLEREFTEAQKLIDASFATLSDERKNLENKVSDRTLQLRKVNEIGRTIIAILDPNELLSRAAEIIESEFDCYYTAFFLLDSTGQSAELKTATGEAGRVLRENRHHLDVNGKSTVGMAIRSKQGRIVQAESNEPVRFDNPLLPYTRSQIVLPLIIRERVIGALEMHSTKENSFTTQDMDTYQTMANEIAISLENSRLYHEAQQTLAEMRATQRQYLQIAWGSLTSEKNLEYSLGDLDLENDKEIAVSLSLRDQVIGNIQLAGTTDWTIEQKNLIESIAAQTTLALENARLVEESQSLAAREKLANEIIAKIWASKNMESILQTTVRELGRTLEAAEVEIEISVDDANE
ncbi:MAG TPA: GAF domain-containing protein [Anaerolineales bacterium]|nr:GAF domain-containing protein [Anaerolineales bacterium]